MKTIEEILADNVKARRKAIGLSQEKLASHAGVDISTVQRIEAKTLWPQPEKIARIAASLSVPVSALYQPDVVMGVKPTIREALAAINAHFAHEDLHTSAHTISLKKPAESDESVEVARILAALDDDQRRAALSILRALTPKADNLKPHSLDAVHEHKKRR